MPRDGNLNIPTLYELMADDLDLWASSSESEDEVGDGWSTFISKRKKYKNKRYVSPTSPKTHSQRPQKGTGPSKQFLRKDSVTKEGTENGWTLVTPITKESGTRPVEKEKEP